MFSSIRSTYKLTRLHSPLISRYQRFSSLLQPLTKKILSGTINGFQFPSARHSTHWKTKRTPYEILGVDRSSTPKEIKMAFYKEAKKHHPDLHTNDPKSKERFQEVAAAYELLSDEQRKRKYDATGFTGDSQAYDARGQHQQHQQQHNSAWNQQHAEDIFNSVQSDVDVIKEALHAYSIEIRDEVNYTVDAVQRGDWHAVYDIAKSHKLLMLGIVVPCILLIRHPPLVLGALRLAWMSGQVVVAVLLQTGNVKLAAELMWKQIVKLSLEKKRRREKCSGR
jgi:hypothetical protein